MPAGADTLTAFHLRIGVMMQFYIQRQRVAGQDLGDGKRRGGGVLNRPGFRGLIGPWLGAGATSRRCRILAFIR